jgi:transcriptional regulator
VYVPKHFEENRIEELHRVIREFPLGALVVNGPSGLDSNHIPFELHEQDGTHVLLAHVARANSVWQESKDGDEAMVVFRAADAYISPNWYPSKHDFHQQVPTWNYQAVHVHGTIRVRDDEKFVRMVVARQTKAHEARVGEARPWRMGDASKEFIDQLLAAIVGIEISIDRIVGKWKLSQNKEERDLTSAAHALLTRGDERTSAEMLAMLRARAT